MAPIVHRLEAIFHEQINFVYIDVDDETTRDIQRDLDYVGLPTYVLLDADGKIIKHWVGEVSTTSFVQAFETILPNQ